MLSLRVYALYGCSLRILGYMVSSAVVLAIFAFVCLASPLMFFRFLISSLFYLVVFVRPKERPCPSRIRVPHRNFPKNVRPPFHHALVLS